MTSSGKLSQTISAALGLPEGAGVLALQALRAAEMITRKGRGTSAAEMTREDAVTILTALVSGAVTSQIAAVTSLLLGMPHVLSFSTGQTRSGFAAVRMPPSPFYRAARTSTLREGLTAVLEETWARDAEFDEDGNERYPGFNALVDLQTLSFTVGMDGRRSGGFAVIKARVSADIVMTRFYSTWPVKNYSESTNYQDLALDPLSAFDSEAKLMTASRVDGPVFDAASRCLLESVPKTRQRLKRLARQ
jgi:hypothetical protein